MTLPRSNSTPVPGRAPGAGDALPPATLDGLAQAARNVAAEHAALSKAIDEEHQAAGLLLARVVEAVRPALPALSSRILVGVVPREGTSNEIDEVWSDNERAVLIAGEARPARAGQGEPVEGEALYLTRDGRFLVVAFEGEDEDWGSDVVPLAPASVAAEGWSVEEIVESLAKALASHEGKRAKSTRRGAERARRLRALADLLEGRREPLPGRRRELRRDGGALRPLLDPGGGLSVPPVSPEEGACVMSGATVDGIRVSRDPETGWVSVEVAAGETWCQLGRLAPGPGGRATWTVDGIKDAIEREQTAEHARRFQQSTDTPLTATLETSPEGETVYRCSRGHAHPYLSLAIACAQGLGDGSVPT